MSKKKVNKKKIKIDKYALLIFFLGLFMIILLVICIIFSNKMNDVNKKIVKLNNVTNEIEVLNENYSILDEIDKKIEDMEKENININNKIDSLTKSIEDLSIKISKYRK